MRLLLDSHVLLWWLFKGHIHDDAQAAIASSENTSVVSVASIWEIELKRAAGRLTAPDDLLDGIAANTFQVLSIAPGHAVAAARLPRHHADPFDRVLVAQAQLEGLTLVTRDERLHAYGAPIMEA